ncbi:hypothetical protein V8E53_014275 [Lactarius tabidus]
MRRTGTTAYTVVRLFSANFNRRRSSSRSADRFLAAVFLFVFWNYLYPGTVQHSSILANPTRHSVIRYMRGSRREKLPQTLAPESDASTSPWSLKRRHRAVSARCDAKIESYSAPAQTHHRLRCSRTCKSPVVTYTSWQDSGPIFDRDPSYTRALAHSFSCSIPGTPHKMNLDFCPEPSIRCDTFPEGAATMGAANVTFGLVLQASCIMRRGTDWTGIASI